MSAGRVEEWLVRCCRPDAHEFIAVATDHEGGFLLCLHCDKRQDGARRLCLVCNDRACRAVVLSDGGVPSVDGRLCEACANEFGVQQEIQGWASKPADARHTA